MKRFEYLAPTSLAEALEMLAHYPNALPLAGGTDLLVQMKESHRPVEALVSLKRVFEIHQVEHNEAVIRLGAAVKAGVIAADERVQTAYTALAVGLGLIGSRQIRNMASLGGNICNASPSADSVPGLLALGTLAVIVGPEGERSLPLETFFVAPGKSALQPGELLKEIVIPRPPENSGSFYFRHTTRAWMDIAFVGAAAAITLDGGGRIANACIALGAVAPTPMRALEAEKVLFGAMPGHEVFEEAGRIAAAEARPIDDLRASADYRRHLVIVLTRRALEQALSRAKNGNGHGS